MISQESRVEGPLPTFRTNLCKGLTQRPNKTQSCFIHGSSPSAHQYHRRRHHHHLHQLTTNLFNFSLSNILGLAKGSQTIIRKTTKLVRLRCQRTQILFMILFQVQRKEEECNSESYVHAASSAADDRERETPHFTVISAVH